ncbi:hypothetical protein H5410_004842 [Solanum commersonii]|uniref:Uncharacterized protein n=1 Tax=Solanum commersonii TaxID=4109 RepID=A0A9J6A5G9_SOLCO|nr:hypothetical protein H5410_004842 [Solanum commersonii]
MYYSIVKKLTMVSLLKINKEFSIYSHQKLVLADSSAKLVKFAERLGDSPFFCLIAVSCFPLASSRPGPLGGIVLLHGTIQRSAKCSFHRLFDPLPSGLCVLEQRAGSVPLATHQACLPFKNGVSNSATQDSIMNAHNKTQFTYARINCVLKDLSCDTPLPKILMLAILATCTS